uniref:Uncharacterized protein n=1 Tax=Avena sativa TaxID=4498 RepID=A0ACD5UEM3_AVESA
MAPPPLATAAAAEYPENILEVRCVGCRETLEVERGLTEFVCPDCGTPQSLPPELMPPRRRRALPMPRGAADARGARIPCGACGELLSVPVGLSRCACPFCGAELAVDSARLRNYILSSAAAAVVPLAPAPASPIVAVRETWQEHSSYSTRAGLHRAEPNARLIPRGKTQIERPSRLIHVHPDELQYPHHMIDREEIPAAIVTVANNSLQRNQHSLGHRTLDDEEIHVFPLNEVRDHVNDQCPSYTVQPKRAQMACLHRVIHSEEMQEGPLSHEVYREARRTELIYDTAATHRNPKVGCSAAPQSSSVEEKHTETPSEIIQEAYKHPYHEGHAKGSHVGCLDLDGVVHLPFNQANHGQESSTEMINKTVARERSISPTGCSVGPNSASLEKRNVKQKTQKQQSDVTRGEDAQQEHPTAPRSLSVEGKHMETPSEIIQQVHKHPYHKSHAEGSHVGCLDLDGVVHPPFNQANHGQEASTEMVNKTLARERSVWPTGCSVGPNSVSVENRNVKQKTQKQQSFVTHAEDAQQEHANQVVQEPINHTAHKEAMSSLPIKETTATCSNQKKSQFVNAKTIAKKRRVEPLNHIIQQAEGHTSDNDCHENRVDFERQSKGKRHGSTCTLKEREQVMPPNKLTDLKQKNVCTNHDIQKEQIEVNVSKTSGLAQKKRRKGSMASSNVQLRRSTRLAKDSVAAVECEPVESGPGDLQDFAPNIQVPSVTIEDEPMEWEPFQRRSPSPDYEVSVATANTESVESEDDEHYDVSPDQSKSESEPPDIDRIITDFCPSTPSTHKMAEEISDESDDPDLTTTPSNTDMSNPEHFARNYCLLLPPEVRRALAKKKSNVLLDRFVYEGSNKVSLHDLSDSEEQQQVKKGKKAGGCGNLSVKVWTLPKGVRVPVSLNTSGLPIGENATLLINFLGALARDAILAPLTYISWKSIPKENKSVMWHIVKLKFDVDPPSELSIMTFIRNKRRVWKSQLKRKYYDSHTTEEERLADRDPRVPKEQWRVLVAYWNTEKFKAISAAGKASRARSTYINVTGSKSFARIRQEESRSGDPDHENPEGLGGDKASAIGAKRRGKTHRHKPGPSPENLQGRSASQAARAKRKAGDEASTLREEVVATEEIQNTQAWADSKEARAERRAEEEAAALRKKVIVMEESQKKLQEDLARMTNAVSAMQEMMSTGGLPNGLMGGPVVPPKS